MSDFPEMDPDWQRDDLAAYRTQTVIRLCTTHSHVTTAR